MPLNDIVNVVITRQSPLVTERGFGIPMILGTHKRFTDLIRFYSSMDEVAVDFRSSDLEYIAAQDIFSQEISPEQISIGRRQVDTIDLDVVTAMPGQDYLITIDGDEYSISSTSTITYSVVELSQGLVNGNRINISVDGTILGTVTSVISFDNFFQSGESIVATVNGTPLNAVPFDTDQPTTLADLAIEIATDAAVASATVTGPADITVVFSAPGANTVDSVVTTGSVTPPIASIVEGAFAFSVDTATTMQNIADAIEIAYPTYSAVVSGAQSTILTVRGPDGVTATVDSFVVEGGSSQAVATIQNPLQPVSRTSIATDIYNYLTSLVVAPEIPVTVVDNGDGTLTLTSKAAGTPWTISVNSTIQNPNRAIVRVTQVQPNQAYQVTINGIPFEYVAPYTVQSATQITSGIVNLINAHDPSIPVTATLLSDGSIELESDDLATPFSLRVSPQVMGIDQGLIISDYLASAQVEDDLTAINNANNTWYGLISTSRTPADVLAIADWVEARVKLFGTASSDSTIIDVPAGTDLTSIAARLNQGGYARTFVMYHQDADYDFPEAAWMGRVLPLIPGSETWKFKTLNSISYSNLTTTQSNTTLDKKANTYEFVGGVGITANGTVAEGEYIDIIRGIDWLSSRIQEYVFAVLVKNPKVPYTDAGIATIQAEVMRALSQGVSNDLLTDDPAPIVTVPRASEVPAADKANRILRDVRFTATLSGAIHAIIVRGTVSV